MHGCNGLQHLGACRVTRFLSEKGFYDTWDFFDSFTWYPLGRVVGGTMYPGRWGQHWPRASPTEKCQVCMPVIPHPSVPDATIAGLIFTAGTIWNILQKLHIPIHVQEARGPGVVPPACW